MLEAVSPDGVPMRHMTFLLIAAGLSGGAIGADLDLTYSVKVENLSVGDVSFRLDGDKPCLAHPQGSCTWDISYGSHSLDAEAGGKHIQHDFELSDESDIQVRCKFDGTKFSGDSC